MKKVIAAVLSVTFFLFGCATHILMILSRRRNQTRKSWASA